MTADLKKTKWGEFSIEDVAEILSGKDIYELERTKGVTPYISATSKNNGIGHFVGNVNNSLESNCLSVNRNGSVGYAFYHPYNALFSNDCRKLRLKKTSKFVGIFIAQQITRQKEKYGYGYKMGTARLKRQKILLPITKKGELDYSFIEVYMREKELEKVSEFRKYLDKRIRDLENYINVEPLEKKEWGEFELDKIFKVKSGKRLTKAVMIKGNIPFIGATDSNNGITEFISNRNVSEDSNVLGVNYNGSVVKNFYHPYKAIFSDDVKRLSFKTVEGNKHLFLFVKNQILKQKEKYQYGYKFNGTRMNRQKILLPINEKKEPDYFYMENFMKRLEYFKLKQYLDYKKAV